MDFRTIYAITSTGRESMNTAGAARKIAGIGLGYVGLPATVAFGRSGLSVRGPTRVPDALVLAVAHTRYREGGWDLTKPLLRPAPSSPTSAPCSIDGRRRKA